MRYLGENHTLWFDSIDHLDETLLCQGFVMDVEELPFTNLLNVTPSITPLLAFILLSYDLGFGCYDMGLF